MDTLTEAQIAQILRILRTDLGTVGAPVYLRVGDAIYAIGPVTPLIDAAGYPIAICFHAQPTRDIRIAGPESYVVSGVAGASELAPDEAALAQAAGIKPHQARAVATRLRANGWCVANRADLRDPETALALRAKLRELNETITQT